MKISDIVEINGKRYDAHSGLPISAQLKHVQSKTPVAVTVKSSTVTSVAAEPQPTRSANHIRKRQTASSRLLMRQYVKKPVVGIKRRTKVQTAVYAPAIAINETALPLIHKQTLLGNTLNSSKSQSVRHFSSVKALNHYSAEQATPKLEVPRPITHSFTVSQNIPANRIKHPKTTADILERALQEATAHQQPLYPKPSRQAKRRINLFAKLRTA